MRLSDLAYARDPAAAELAKKQLLQHIRQNLYQMFRAGPISLWLRGGYDVERTEELLESLVEEGILRAATKEELSASAYRSGYFLTDEGFHKLPVEDRSLGST